MEVSLIFAFGQFFLVRARACVLDLSCWWMSWALPRCALHYMLHTSSSNPLDIALAL